MSYLGTKPANQVIDSTLIADGTVTPSDLSTGRPVWDTSGNLGVGTNSPNASFKATFSGLFGIRLQSADTNNSALNIGSDTGSGYAFIDATKTGTGTFLPLRFSTNDTERMRLDSNGNVGIGTSSPSYRLQVGDGSADTRGLFLSNNNFSIGVGRSTGTIGGYIGSPSSDVMVFSGNGGAEKMRIDTSGNLLVGTTARTYTERVSINYTGQGQGIVLVTSTTASSDQIAFNNGNGNVGKITTSGTSTSYVTSSDYRLKENIAPMTGALAKVSQLKPCTYTWKADGSDGQGFIAHELQEVVPDAVVGEKDAVDADGNPVYQGIDTSFLVATLTAAIQELKAELDTVKSELATLKGAE